MRRNNCPSVPNGLMRAPRVERRAERPFRCCRQPGRAGHPDLTCPTLRREPPTHVAAYPLVSLILTSTSDEVALDRETSDGGEQVAAVRRCVDSTLRDRNLRKQVVDVRVLAAAGPDDERLAGQRVA